MKYEIQKDKIFIYSKDEFNPKHILECGQIFSYKKLDDGYEVLSANKRATISELPEYYVIETNSPEYFVNFFDLDTDYSKIKANLLKNYPYLEKCISYGEGIRILKQDYFETIISFIVSANNNIKRIQKILFAIREKYGDKMDGYYAFPTQKQLLGASVEDFKELGAGYRDKYLYEVVRQLDGVDFAEMAKYPTPQLNKKLLSLMGVGQKVADCIMLFCFNRGDVFPVDTWIEKVYCSYFNEEHDRNKIRKNLLSTFGENAGYAQQYLFYSQREGI